MPSVKRCAWCGEDPLYIRYHDEEWGRPLYDDRRLFEFLILESFQAGLSWITILRKRAAFQIAFDDFDPVKIQAYDDLKINELLNNPGIIRNRRKIQASIANAKAFLALQQKTSFADWLWAYADEQPPKPQWARAEDIPVYTPRALRLSQDLKKAGFQFLGATTVYAFMQATGIVNDHLLDCHCAERSF